MTCPDDADATYFAPTGASAQKRKARGGKRKLKCGTENRQGVFLCERCGVKLGRVW